MMNKWIIKKSKAITFMLSMLMVLQIFIGGFGNVSFASEMDMDSIQTEEVESKSEDPLDNDESDNLKEETKEDLENSQKEDENNPDEINKDEEKDKDPKDLDTDEGSEDLIKDSENEDEVDEVDSEEGKVKEELLKDSLDINLFSLMPLVHTPEDLGNIFTFNSLTLNGNPVGDDPLTLNNDDTLIIKYDWEVEGAFEGDYSSIIIPSVFEIIEDISKPIIISVDGEDLNVGQYTITAATNELKFVFNNKIENLDVKSGFVGFGLQFNLEKFNEDTIQEISFNDSINKKLTVILKPKVTGSAIYKTGLPDEVKDAKSITWTVNIINTENTTITGASVIDLIPEGLALDNSSIEIFETSYGYNGEITLGSQVNNISNDGPDNLLLQNLELKPYKGYQIEYKTNIEDIFKKEFTNTATLSYGETQIDAVSTVNKLERSSPIEKSGQALNNDKIKWTIDINKNSLALTDMVLEDSLPAGLSLDASSLQVYKLQKSGSNWNTNGLESNYTLTSGGFPINFGDVSADQAFRLIFETDVDYSGDYQKNNDFKNTAVLKSSGEKVGEASAEVRITRASIIKKTGSSSLKVDEDNKIITWTILVNEAKHNISNAIVKDTLPEGLEFITTSVAITVDNTEINDYSGVVVQNGQEVKFNLGDIGKDTYKIVFKTKITNFKINKFTNTVGLEGNGVGSGTSTSGSNSPAKNDYSKSFKAINYNLKTMDWEIKVNPWREKISQLTLTDTFPNNGLILLDDTLSIKKGNDNLSRGTDYSLSPIDGNYNEGFIIEFSASSLPIDKLVTIKYTTSFDPEKGIIENVSSDRKYINSVNFKGLTINENEINDTKKAETQLNTQAWNSGIKEGSRVNINGETYTSGWESGKERKIKWDVYVNYLKQNLGRGVVLKDDWDYEGTFDEDSLKVYKYSVAQNGDIQMEEELTSGFIVSPDADGYGWTLTFSEALNERYVIVYTTSVPDISKKTYKNKASLNANGKEYPYEASVSYNEYNKFLTKEALNLNGNKVYTDDELLWEININESLSSIKNAIVTDIISEGMVYLDDSLEIFALNTNTPISEDEYVLTLTLNEDETTSLKIEFKEEITQGYKIRYKTVVVAESGMVYNNAEFEGDKVTTVRVETEKLSASQFSFVGATSSNKGKIIIEKFDGDTEEPIDASFSLYYLLNGEKKYLLENQQTVEGKLEIGNLSFRTYYLEEISAPSGYGLIEELEIVLDKNDTDYNYDSSTRTKTLYIANYRLGELYLLKVDKNDQTKNLKGAEFTLINLDTEETNIYATNDQGQININDLKHGNYRLRETKAPAGYRLSEEVFEFTIGLNETEEGLYYNYKEEFTVTNERLPSSPVDYTGSISIKKMDKDDNKINLQGAEFELRDKGGKLVQVLVTDRNGNARANDLEYGDYTIEETRAPSGYILDKSTFKIKINRTSQNETLEVFNEKKPEVKEVPIVPEEPEVPDLVDTPDDLDFEEEVPQAIPQSQNEKPILPRTGSQEIPLLLIIGSLALTLGLMLKIKRLSKKPR